MASAEEENYEEYDRGSLSPLSRFLNQKRISISSFKEEGDDEAARALDRGDADIEEGTLTPPPPMSKSPSLASSVGYSSRHSPLSRPSQPDSAGISRTTSRLALARRLGQLAEQLTIADGQDDFDEVSLSDEINRLERTLSRSSNEAQPSRPFHMMPRSQSELLQRQYVTSDSRTSSYLRSHRRPASMSADFRGQSDVPPSLRTSTTSPALPPRFSDLSTLLPNDQETEQATSPPPKKPRKPGMTTKQANSIIAEVNALNEELTTVVTNLRARQEESDHIHSLLVERAERAAQRIIFLQTRISYLEEELRENDDELQYLRICLKALEVQMPPNPDMELQQCIRTFKQDYQALKKKRVNKSSLASASVDASFASSAHGVEDDDNDDASMSKIGDDVSDYASPLVTPTRRRLRNENIRRTSGY